MSETSKLKLYLDNCCFNRPYDDQTQLKVYLEAQAKLAIQQMILSGKHCVVWSSILEYENMQNPFDIRKDAIKQWQELACKYIHVTDSILAFAESLYSKGIKTKDAIHISCAIEAKCDYFITTDKKLLNSKVKGIKIINPFDFIREMEV